MIPLSAAVLAAQAAYVGSLASGTIDPSATPPTTLDVVPVGEEVGPARAVRHIEIRFVEQEVNNPGETA